MGKVKVAICIGDKIYQERFVKCLINHYKERYEFHIFGDYTELVLEPLESYGGYILGDVILEQIELLEEQMERTLLLKEDNKYQEVYKLMEQFEILLGDRVPEIVMERNAGSRAIGVYSLTIPHLQMPFSAALAGVCADTGKTILIDLQINSGLRDMEEPLEFPQGLEDVVTMAMSGEYSKSRVLSAIGHYQTWDYIHPMKNSSCLGELNAALLESIQKYLSKELGYQTIILNLEDGMHKFIELCEEIYLIYQKGEPGGWRERSYVKEMQEKGRDDVLHRIKRIEVATVFDTDGGWDMLVEQWKWNFMGDVLRKIVQEAKRSG